MRHAQHKLLPRCLDPCQSAISGNYGIVANSPRSTPASVASTTFPTGITLSVSTWRSSVPAMSQNSVDVAPGRTACTRTPLSPSS